MIMYNSVNEAGIEILKDLLENGTEVSPRGIKVKEIINYQFGIKNAHNQIVTFKQRRLNYAFSIIEKISFISGRECPELICLYNSNMKKYINSQTNKFDGDYAPRIYPQLKWCYDRLKRDRDSRQAIITIRDQQDLHESMDQPCTLSFQFLIRDNKLHMIVTMRSNDAYISTCGYDLMNFTFILNVLAHWLNIETGNYYHNAGSLHLYENNFEQAKNLIENQEKNNINIKIGNYWNLNFDETYKYIDMFWKEEESIRNTNTYKPIMNDYHDHVLNQYLEYLKNWWEYKRNK